MQMTSLPPGYRAIVIGASGGIGSAIAEALAADPNCGELIRLSRRADGLDVTDESSVAQAVEKLEGTFQLVFCATGGLTIDGVGPEKALRQISADAMMKQFALNAVGTALVLKHFSPKLDRRNRSLMGFLSARVGSIGDNRLGGWISYRAAKAALNQIVRTVAVELSRTHPETVLAALHPGTVATSLTEGYAAGHSRMPPTESAEALLSVLDRFESGHSGGFFAYDGSAIEW
ncbi:MAG: hypothetical protein RLZZ444_2349 [Pseudomonadota bacterium]